jgi:hypothetical protein
MRITALLSLLMLLCACTMGGSGGGGGAGNQGNPGGSGNGGGSGPPAATGIFAIEFPGEDMTSINSYLIPQSAVAGDVAFVIWSSVDSGNGQLDWSSVESQIAPWWSGGKKTALVVWAVSDSNTIVATPNYVLAQLPPTVSCTVHDSLYVNVPEFTAPAFQSAYSAFLKEFFAKYGNDKRIAYIRAGIGGGGETYPNCTAEQEQFYGLTQPSWQTYVDAMLQVEHANAGSVPMMVALNCYGTPCPDGNPYAFPGNVASLAAQYGFGIGQEALQKSDIVNYQDGQACEVNWCGFFTQYSGSPLHELQFAEPTCPDNSCEVGSPIELLPFAKARGANVVEMSLADLSIAYVPPPGEYTQQYQEAISEF